MLFTIGYEKSQIEDFIATLQHHRIQLLIDVRDRAQSRKKGFSKSTLSSALSKQGIDYLHLRELGDPREGRLAARAGEWGLFRSVYDGVIASQAGQEAIREIARIVSHRNAALMCFERFHRDCHRSIVANCVAKLGASAPTHIEVAAADAIRPVRDRRQGAAA